MRLVEILTPEIEATIGRLSTRKFRPDPMAGEHFSRVASIVSSSYKRHGFILEQLKLCPYFEAWEDRGFEVPNTADHIVDSAIDNPNAIFDTETSYRKGHRTIQVDAIVFDKNTRVIRGYEVKRGTGLHDAGKRRSILRDLLCLQILLKSYGVSKGLDVAEAHSHIIFYYGQCSIKEPFSLTRENLDDHFQWPIVDAVEEVNEYFRESLLSILSI